MAEPSDEVGALPGLDLRERLDLLRRAPEPSARLESWIDSCRGVTLAHPDRGMELAVDQLERDVSIKELKLNAKKELQQMIFEYVSDWRDLTNTQYGIAQLSISHQRNLH